MGGVGIFGLVSYIVSQRARELGLRAALGATRGEQFANVVAGALAMVGAGVVIGGAGSSAMGRFVGSLLYQVSPTDPATLAATALFLAGVAVLAAAIPALRAARTDPAEALRV